MPVISPPVDTAINVRIPPWSVILGISILLIVLMLLLQFSGINVVLFHWLNGWSRYTGEPLWANITLFGEGLLGVALVGPVARWRRDIAWSLLLAALLAVLVVHGAKELFDIPRPAFVLPASDVNVIGPLLQAVSFPSGHTATITILATVVALHLNRRYFFVAALLAILLVGLSRVVVGAHWPMDVLGGMVLGWWLSLAGIQLALRLPFGLKRNWQTALCIFSLAGAALFWGAETGQFQAVLLQQSLALLAGVLGLVTLAELWWPAKNRGA